MPEMGQIDELQLERAVHLQIISDLRAQLQQVPPLTPWNANIFSSSFLLNLLHKVHLNACHCSKLLVSC